MTTLTAVRAASLPRVNLLPPEIAAAARLSTLKKLLALIVVGALVVTGLLYLWANNQANSSQERLDSATAENSTLKSEAARYAQVPLVAAQVQSAEGNLATAMAPEVRVSFLLNDLSLTIPSAARLTSLSIGIGPTDPGVQAAATAALSTGVTAPPGIAGSVTYEGKARSFDAVAAWLASFAKQTSYADAYLTSATKDTGTTTVGTTFTFSSSSTLTPEALSNRFTKVGQ